MPLIYTPPKYRDQWVRALGVPLITLFGYYLTYNNIRLNWMMAYELASDALKIFLVWQAVRAVLVWLDRCRPWQLGLGRRLAVQVPLTCGVGVGVLAALVYTEYAFIRDYPNEHFWSFDVVIAVIFLLLVNVVYTALYYYDQYRRNHTWSEQLAAEKQALAQELEKAAASATAETAAVPEVPVAGHLVVKLGRREVVLPYADIRGFYSADKETYVVTCDGKQYVLDQSLDRLGELLPGNGFFRANRQFLLTPGAVEQVVPEAYGKLGVQLVASARLPARITISRERAAAFRQWLRRPAEAAQPGTSSPMP